MNGIKFLMALAAVFILIMPAFSMPDNGMGQDGKQKTCDCQCDCLKLKMGQDDKQKTCGCPNSMMDQDGKQMYQGQDDKQKTCGCPESMTGQDGKQMWQEHDGKQIRFMMGQDDKQMGHKAKSMMGDREKGDNGGIKVVIVNVHV